MVSRSRKAPDDDRQGRKVLVGQAVTADIPNRAATTGTASSRPAMTDLARA